MWGNIGLLSIFLLQGYLFAIGVSKDVVIISCEEVHDPQPIRLDTSDGSNRLVKVDINPEDPSCHFYMTGYDNDMVTFSLGGEPGGLMVTAAADAYEIEFVPASDAPENAGLTDDARADLAKRQQWHLNYDESLVPWLGDIVRFESFNGGDSETSTSKYKAMLSTPSADLLQAPGADRRTYLTTSREPGKPGEETRESRFKILPVEHIKGKNLVRGKSAFDYFTQLNSWYTPSFHPDWKIAKAAGQIRFQADLQDFPGTITVAVSEQLTKVSGGMYNIQINIIPETDETTGVSTIKRVIEVSKDVIGSVQISVEDFVTEQQAKSSTYVIAVNNGLVTIKDSTLDKELVRYQDPNPLLAVQYVGFGGMASDVSYTNITIGALTDEARGDNIYIPDGFVQLTDRPMEKVSTGSLDGSLEAWGINTGQLYQWNGKQWILVTAVTSDNVTLDKVNDVAVASDGTLCCLNDNQAYQFDRKAAVWKKLGVSPFLSSIAVGDENNIWGINSKMTRLYRFSGNQWKEIIDACIGVGVGLDGTVVVINDRGQPYVYAPQAGQQDADANWLQLEISNSITVEDPKLSPPTFAEGEVVHLISVSVIDRTNIYGITQHGRIVHCVKDEWRWVAGNLVKQPTTTGTAPAAPLPDRDIAQGLIEFDANAAGTIFAVTRDKSVYKKGTQGIAVQAQQLPAQVQQAQSQTQKLNTVLRQRPQQGAGVTRLGRRDSSKNKNSTRSGLSQRDVIAARSQTSVRLNAENLAGQPRAAYLGGGRTGTDRYSQRTVSARQAAPAKEVTRAHDNTTRTVRSAAAPRTRQQVSRAPVARSQAPRTRQSVNARTVTRPQTRVQPQSAAQRANQATSSRASARFAQGRPIVTKQTVARSDTSIDDTAQADSSIQQTSMDDTSYSEDASGDPAQEVLAE